MIKIIKIVLVSIFLILSFYGQSANAGKNKPYVILISFDGFRWDYPDRGLSPNLQKLSEDGVRALSLRPVFPTKTFPNHISIVTGLYPEHHGIIHNEFENPYNGEKYKISDTSAVRNPIWYSGEFIWETAKKQGIINASFFWPGSELNLLFRRPTYYKKYDHSMPYADRVKGVLHWLQLSQYIRPHFITLYFHETDSKGHDFGPNSEQINQAIKLLDQQIGDLMNGLTQIGLKDSVNIIILSDHGMTEIYPDKIINVEKLLQGKKCQISGDGPMMMINPLEEGVFEILSTKSQNYHVYKKEELPDYYHFSHHPFINPIILIAKPGYSLVDNKGVKNAYFLKDKGNHGYEKDVLDMHGIFITSGPAFKKGYKTGTVWNIDIYPLICEILHIIPHQPIDGELERIEFVLNEN